MPASSATALQKPNTNSWVPQPGSQTAFLACPADEVLYEGTRGPGKSDALLMSFAKEIGKWGSYWRGILFREEATQLDDIISKTQRWFAAFFPEARYLGGNRGRWVWPTGEQLLLRHMRIPSDYWKYHGHEYPWIGWEELTNWSFPDCFEIMAACNRSTGPRAMPRITRATCNPYGKGHQWVKSKFIDPVPRGKPYIERYVHPLTGEPITHSRVAIHGDIFENKILLAQDPMYLTNLQKQTDPNILAAWLYGSWDIVSGGIFDGAWSPETQVLDPFKIPSSWYVDRAFDWGSSAPYSVGWFAESDGTEAVMADGTKKLFPRGSVFHIAELYGWNGRPNEGVNETVRQIAIKIKSAEPAIKTGLLNGQNIHNGPADASLFNVVNGECYADQMGNAGIKWTKSYKEPGSRVQGIEKMRQMFLSTRDNPPEQPGFYVFNTCRHWLRTVPVLPRDDKNPDDADSTAEDHAFDMTRYRLMKKPKTGKGSVSIGRVR